MIGNRVRLAMDRLTIRWVDLMVASSTSVADTLIAEGCPLDRMAHATNGRSWSLLADQAPDQAMVDVRRSQRAAAVRLVAVGNLKEEKDHPTLIRALGRVVGSGRDVELFLAGTGSDEARRDLERVAAESGVADRVVFGGWRTDPMAVMASADGVVHASVDEASPQAVYEAAGLGVPVIATWAGGIRDILGRHQELLPPRDVESLATAIMELVDDPGAARAKAAGFAAEIRERYGSEACGSSYLEACRLAMRHRTGRQVA